MVEGFDPAGADRDRHAQHFRQHCLDEIPIDRLGEEQVDVFVAHLGPGAEEVQPLPIADAGLELDAQQVRKPENSRALALRVGMDRIRPHIRVIFDQVVEDVVAFP